MALGLVLHGHCVGQCRLHLLERFTLEDEEVYDSFLRISYVCTESWEAVWPRGKYEGASRERRD